MSDSTNWPPIRSLWRYDDPAESERVFRVYLDPSRSQPPPAWKLEVETQIGRALALQRKFDEALAQLARVSEEMKAHACPRVEILVPLETARIENDLGNIAAAIELATYAFRLAEQAEEFGLALDSAHMVAYIEEPEAAVEWGERALRIAEESDVLAVHRWVGTLAVNLGHKYLDLTDFESAERCFHKALQFRLAQGDDSRAREVECALALVERLRGNTQVAWELQRVLYQQCRDVGDPSGYVAEECGECLLALGRDDEARPYFAEAYRLHSGSCWFPPTESARLDRLAELGGVGDLGVDGLTDAS